MRLPARLEFLTGQKFSALVADWSKAFVILAVTAGVLALLGQGNPFEIAGIMMAAAVVSWWFFRAMFWIVTRHWRRR